MDGEKVVAEGGSGILSAGSHSLQVDLAINDDS